MMRRRTFIAGLGSVAAWPAVARAQQGDRMRRIGVLMNGADTRRPFHGARHKQPPALQKGPTEFRPEARRARFSGARGRGRLPRTAARRQ